MYCKRNFPVGFEGVWNRFGVLAVAVMLLSGCATYVHDTAWEPAAFNFRGANRLVLTEVTGRSVDRALMLEILREQVARDGWWQLIDLSARPASGISGWSPGTGRSLVPHTHPRNRRGPSVPPRPE